MPGKWACGLLAIFGGWLVAGVYIAQGTDLAHFQAVGLVRFAPAVEIPEIILPDVQGKEVPLRSFRGQVVLLNFWTTW